MQFICKPKQHSILGLHGNPIIRDPCDTGLLARN